MVIGSDLRAAILGAAKAVFEIVVLVLLGLLLARLFWVTLEGHRALTPVTPLSAIPQIAANGASSIRVDTSILSRENPFGRDAVIAADLADDAPETTLNLTLKGLRAVTGDVAGTAIIVTTDNVEGSFSVGDRVLDGVTVERILSDRVVLKRNGQLESLYLRERNTLKAISGAEPRQQLESLETFTPPERGQVSDGATLWGAVRINAVVENDRTIGYRVSPRGSADIMAQAGLVPGDVIVGFNGQRVATSNVDELVGAFETSGQQIDLEIERGDQSLDLTIVFGGDN